MNRRVRAISALATFVLTGVALGATPRYWPTVVVLEVRQPSSDRYWLLYDRGEAFNDHDSVSAPVSTEARAAFSTVHLALPSVAIARIRITPPTQSDPIDVHRLCLNNRILPWRYRCWDGPGLARDFRPLHDLSRFELSGGDLELQESGLDPYFGAPAAEFGSAFEAVGRIRSSEALLAALACAALLTVGLRLTRAALRRILRALAWLAVTFALPALAVEAFMIVGEPWLFRGPFEYDADLGFRVRPGYQGANRFGFNARELPLAKPAGLYRILVVGDSFGWEGGLEGNYTGRLQRAFETHFGRHRVDVISAGYSMTHTVEQLAMLRKYGLQYDPDLVLLGFYAGNDFYDGDPHRKRIVLNDLYVDVDTRAPLHTLFGRPLVPQSRLLLLLEQGWAVRQGVESRQGGRVTFSEPAYLKAEAAHLLFYDRKLHEAGRFKENVAYILSGVSDMKALVQSHGARFAVAVLPAEFSVDDAVARRLLATLPIAASEFDPGLAQEILDRYLESEGIPYRDLLEPFREASRSHRLYVPRDGHWNAAGNALAAETLFPFLLEKVRDATGWE